jgi:manganese transport protein
MTATAGAAFAVGVGYMDPGNWATDLNATRFGDALLWAVLLSGLAAGVLQLLVVHYAAASGEDLDEAIARRWPRASSWLWAAYALAIVATEIAEFVGLVLGIELVAHVGLPAALAIATAAFGALLLAGGATARRFERLAIGTTIFLATAYAIDLIVLHPALGPIVQGATVPSLPGPGAALAVVGIVGATIMPHNLFLHGGLIVDRLRAAPADARRAIERAAVRTTVFALTVATLVNGAILVVGGAVHATSVEAAFATLVPVAGRSASTLFGLALIIVAIASAASGARAGDVVCHARAPVRLTMLTRRIFAVAPATLLLAFGVSPTALLVGSQIVLGLVLPAVVIPLLALVIQGTLHRTHGGRFLLASSSAVVLGALACDGFLLSTFLPRT